MPGTSVVAPFNQAAVTIACLTGGALSAGTPTWQLAQAMMPPSAACPSQHEQGALSACAGVAEATTTAGRATQNPAAKSARVAARRMTKAITLSG
jgi:hypothetical protein